MKKLLILLAVLALAAGTAGAATITIINNDAAGEGFNDPAPRSPVGGNPGMTLGEQRLYIFQYAASIWGSILTSPVEIFVRAQFNPQTCSATSAVLGSAGPVTLHRDFASAPVAGHWYHQALANRLNGADLSAANPDINATFNSNIDLGCFGPGLVWYYGTDGNEGANIELLPVVLHELGHGLGFSTSTSGSTGNYFSSFPHIWDRFLTDNTNGLHWDQMTAAQRQASAIGIDRLVWDGPAAIYSANVYLGRRPQMVINSPGSIAGSYPAQVGSFGAPLTDAGVTGDVALADDGTDDPNDACEPLINGPSLFGKMALIKRGTCTFVSKCQAAQAAGAIGVLISNNVATGLPPMGGTDPSITIPCVGISQAAGDAIIAELGGGVNVTLNLHPTLKAGADPAGRPLMYSPNPFASGSSVSHWDITMNPNALMEPAITGSLHDTVDLTKALFVDIGWFPGSVATTLEEFVAEGASDGILLRWRFADPTDVTAVAVHRAEHIDGPWARAAVRMNGGAEWTALDGDAEPGRTYWYRLEVTDREGTPVVMGLVSAERDAALARRTFLGMPVPNPAPNGSMVSFGLERPEFVRLSVHDVSGRKVATLHEGMMLAGHYTRQWDGRTDGGTQASAGVYFVNLRTSKGVETRRVTIVR